MVEWTTGMEYWNGLEQIFLLAHNLLCWLTGNKHRFIPAWSSEWSIMLRWADFYIAQSLINGLLAHKLSM